MELFLNFKQKTYRDPILKLTRPKIGLRDPLFEDH